MGVGDEAATEVAVGVGPGVVPSGVVVPVGVAGGVPVTVKVGKGVTVATMVPEGAGPGVEDATGVNEPISAGVVVGSCRAAGWYLILLPLSRQPAFCYRLVWPESKAAWQRLAEQPSSEVKQIVDWARGY